MALFYKVALIQLYPKPMQIEANFARAASYIQKAASRGAHLAVLPEYHLTNWVPADPEFGKLCKQWKTYLNKYQALAKSLNINIVPGTIVEQHRDAESGNDILINVAYFIDNNGDILGKYQKKNLWHTERSHLISSTYSPHEVIQTPIGPIGFLICWDLGFPEAFRELIAQGAKTIIIPTFWTLADCTPYGLTLNPRSEALFITSTLVSRAFENTCAVVFVNAGGPVGAGNSGPYAGLSQVAMPFVGALGKETRESGEEGMSIVDVDMEILEEAEKNYKVREDLAREDWHYTYRHSSKGFGGVEKGKL